ncbi:MAG: DUF4367 domain-containing protein [Oscillospiraceae bacterium]|jgi:hypothetical protein|nr:DUF4367 domain-containing protein [Oscillospiraceae bacterium]
MAPKNLNDKIFDAMLDVAAEEVLEQRLKEWEALDTEEHVFSPEFERKMRRLLKGRTRQVRVQKARRFFSRAAAVLVIFMVVGFALTMSVSAIRVQVLNTIIEYGETFFGVHFGGTADENSESDAYVYPEYVPVGYELEVDDEMPIGRIVSYKNEETGGVIDFLQLLKLESTVNTFDSEHVDIPYEVTYKDQRLLVFESNTEGYASYIIWESDTIFYELSASLPVDELLKIARSTFG